MRRRPVLSVIGKGGEISSQVSQWSETVGQLAMSSGFRLVTGGRGGVMEAVSRGARHSKDWQEGRILGILPAYDISMANSFVDVVIPSGLGLARNLLVVSSADVVLAIAGGSGTLSEMALAWQLGKEVIALTPSGGWAEALAGKSVDERRSDRIHAAATPEEAIQKALSLLPSTVES